MEILEDYEKATEIETSSIVIADTQVWQTIEEIASLYVLQQKIDEMGVLVAFGEFYNQRKVAQLQNLFLCL